MARVKLKDEARQFNEGLGRRISGAREAAGMQCRDLARAARITRTALYSYETGRTSCPALVLTRIAAALEMPVAALLPKFTCGNRIPVRTAGR